MSLNCEPGRLRAVPNCVDGMHPERFTDRHHVRQSLFE